VGVSEKGLRTKEDLKNLLLAKRASKQLQQGKANRKVSFLFFLSSIWLYLYPTSLAAAFSVFAQVVFKIAISLLNGSAHFVIEIRGEFCHAVNGAVMSEDLFKEFCFCLRASGKGALGSEIPTVNSLAHLITPFLTITIITIFQDSRAAETNFVP
jgi:hypothetical protein